MARKVTTLAAALLSVLGSSCLSADFNRSRQLATVEASRIDRLEVGSAQLTECLAALGAPTRVWELEGGAALAWHWVDRSDWGISFAIPTGEALNANLSYGDLDRSVEGVVLFFDQDWILTSMRRGQIGELLNEARRRPSLVD